MLAVVPPLVNTPARARRQAEQLDEPVEGETLQSGGRMQPGALRSGYRGSQASGGA